MMVLRVKASYSCIVTQPLPKSDQAREVIVRANRKVAPLLGILMVRPHEFGERIRKNAELGRNPRRLLKCIDDVEEALRHRGIEMHSYFEALRREVFRTGKAR
jgi:hypothetical protein